MTSKAKKEYNKKYFAKWYSIKENKIRKNLQSSSWSKTEAGKKYGKKYYKSRNHRLSTEDKFRNKVDRFWNKVEKTDTCWNWIGTKLPFGYGRFGFGYAHRFSYILHYGEIPIELFVLHKCDNPPCVNPEHLWVGTQSENIKDRDNKGRGRYGHLKLNIR